MMILLTVQGQTKEPPQAPTQEQIAAQDYPTYRMYSTKFDIFSKNCIGVLHNLEPMSSLNGDLGVEVVPKKYPHTFCLWRPTYLVVIHVVLEHWIYGKTVNTFNLMKYICGHQYSWI